MAFFFHGLPFRALLVTNLPRPSTMTFHLLPPPSIRRYFHNWTGNRVTCRDWFQLTLKEGLTVFRDSCFSADMTSEAVKRIEDVRVMRSHPCLVEGAGPARCNHCVIHQPPLWTSPPPIWQVRVMRSHQFVEDAGPMSHPIRPESYIAIDNFYTVTVYEKVRAALPSHLPSHLPLSHLPHHISPHHISPSRLVLGRAAR